MSSLSSPALLAIFVASAVVIWAAGVRLSGTTDVLADRLHLGSAIGGVILLAVATNLPEIAITVAAAASGEVSVAVGNVLGGIAIQTVVLVALDAFGIGAGPPLTYRAASLQLVLEGSLVVAVLLIAVMGSQLPSSLIVGRVAPGGLLIAIAWVGGIALVGNVVRRRNASAAVGIPSATSSSHGPASGHRPALPGSASHLVGAFSDQPSTLSFPARCHRSI
mgnify:CR=1 FL=1